MSNESTLRQLLEKDSRCRTLYEGLPKDVQTALQEQRQNIHTCDDLLKAVRGFEKRLHR